MRSSALKTQVNWAIHDGSEEYLDKDDGFKLTSINPNEELFG